MARVKVKEAAEMLGVSEQFIREGLKSQRLPFGVAVKMSSQWSYHISEGLLKAYIDGTKDAMLALMEESIGAKGKAV
ncbi:MAG: hypothetical protein ACOX3W_00600 [Christensenellaceae bacterium]